MLISEFTDITGFRPTHECYEKHIEPMYNDSDLLKDAWCSQWKRKGGIAEAYQWQVVFDTAKINEQKELAHANGEQADKLANLLKIQTETSDRLNQDKKELQEKVDRLSHLEDRQFEMLAFIIQQAEQYSSAELREKAIEMMGEREYIAYKINHDLNLWQADKDLIIELLNQ